MFNTARIFGFFNRDSAIDGTLRGREEVVYGARAMNVQLPGMLKRHTIDYDIYSKSPKAKAKRLEKVLDGQSKGDYFYTKPAMHPGTWKVMDIGFDNRKGTHDDFGVADFTKPERKIRFNVINGIRYARLSERAKDARRSLSDPEFIFRHEKDRKDLWRIKEGKKYKF